MDYSKMTKVDRSLPVDDRIAFLKYCADMYELGTSPISDMEYDKEYYELEQAYPDNPFFHTVGGMDDEHIYGSKIKHNVIMGSLTKCPTVDDFRQWVVSTFPKSIPSFVLQHKIDGLSLSLHYSDGKLVQAITRGDGETGVDVMANALFIKGVRKSIPTKGDVEVRGECNKNRQDFYKNWHTSVKSDGYKNPRNFTAGSLNQKDPKVTEERGLNFIAYEEVRLAHKTEMDKITWIEQNGFETIRSTTKRTKEGLTVDAIVKAIEIYMNSIDRANLSYDIDGIVVKMNDIEEGKKMGSVAGGRKPKSSRAVKFPPEIKETTVLDITARVGRTGVAVPVAILAPVDLGGAVIQRATMHNFGMVVGGNIGINSRVRIAKKGDIIPQIVEVLSKGDSPLVIPSICPSCNHPLSWTDTKVHLVCTNENCPCQLAAKLDHWCKTIGIRGLGKGILGKLCDKEELEWDGKPILSSLSELYYMLDNDRSTEHPFRKYAYLKEYFGEKAYQNMVDAIHSVNEIPLPLFIEALGIGRIGTSSKEIVDIAPTIDDIDKLTVDDLAGIPRFGQIKAESFVNGWKELRSDINRILRYGIKIRQNATTSDKLKDKKFCFTGSFSQPRDKLEAIVAENGGRCGSAGKDTILVWDNSEQGNKYNKSIAVGAKIISESEFFDMLK